jgi:tetratricopeptide (TPR) repeat protein
VTLYKAWEQRIETRKATEEGTVRAQPNVSRQTWILLRASYFLVGTVLMGFRYINILWPTRSREIEMSDVFALAAVVAAGLMLQHRGQKTLIARRDDDFGRKREPIALNTTTVVAAAIILAAAAGWAVYEAAKILAPTHERAIFSIGIAIVAAAFGFVFALLKKNKQDQDSGKFEAMNADLEAKSISRRKTRNIAVLMTFEAVILGILSISMRPGIREAVFYGQFAVLFALLRSLGSLKLWTLRLARSGQYKRALRLNRVLQNIPGYGRSLEGSILLNAGRYTEAMEFLKPLAFTNQGIPRFRSIELYTYAIALENSGGAAEAEILLEQSVREAPDRDSFKVALATCLLAQEKRADDACRLLEEAVRTGNGGSSYAHRSDGVKRVARYAWALAGIGRRVEAEQKINEALTGGRTLKPWDEAGMHYFVGEAWRVMRETSKARAEFEKALRIAPDGNTAINAKKGLAKLGDGWRVQAN